MWVQGYLQSRKYRIDAAGVCPFVSLSVRKAFSWRRSSLALASDKTGRDNSRRITVSIIAHNLLRSLHADDHLWHFELQ